MKYVIVIGQVIFVAIWVFLLGGLVFADGKSQVALFALLLMILSLLHVLQVFIFYSAFHQPLKDKGLPVSGKEYLAIFLFGVIGWLMALQKRNQLGGKPTNPS
ncbi:DUF1145 domain-containing protein [Aliidiomarina haloalkalitolerans]|uniref:DUF1145 domain-containing protein n=1 Tax=Aliidiomarina haloalkalitolerans TaxID=859059 RepID=A0A432VVU9_9GAMM|nr:DUF1145 domain-containing protein [Aliidiomarina haloalkalitolerans]RUO20624.1 hypothetical protein CWE06_04755 [Aliidiomarina haloalkalitolerans]